MDVGQEINKHLEWIEAVVSLLDSEVVTKEELDEISQHDHCALGQWLNSEDSKEFKDLPELEKLKRGHDEFHECAGELISSLMAGEEAEAMESKEKFIEMSRKIVRYLQALQESAGASGDEAGSGRP